MSSVATGAVLLLSLHLLGLGPALLLWRRLELPPRYVAPLAVAATALVSYIVFWSTFVAPSARMPAVGAAVLASLVGLAIAGRDPDVRAALRSLSVWAPSLAAGAYALLCLWPFLAGGAAVNERFAWKLPSDNILPAILADRVVLGASVARPVPPLWPNGDRTSERPPLQAAIVVAVGSTVRGVHEYQILATLCQAQWLPAVWLLGAACGVPQRRLAIVVAACALSGYFFVNTVFTWPKLLAGALALVALAIALEPEANRPGARRDRVLTVAALTTLALLAHPGPIFTLAALPLCWPLLRPIVGLRTTFASTLAAAGVCIALVAPWLAYQVRVDPPTGRLLREHLGDGRAEGTVLAAIAHANAERSAAEHVRVRLGNLVAQAGRPWRALWPRIAGQAQAEQFFRHGSSLGLLFGGLLLTLTGRPRSAIPSSEAGDAAVRRLTVTAVVALALWSLLVFPADGALIHHGSPVTTMLLFIGGAYGLTRLPGWAAGALLAAHAAVFLLTWILPTLGSRAV